MSVAGCASSNRAATAAVHTHTTTRALCRRRRNRWPPCRQTSVIWQWLNLNSKHYNVTGTVWQPDQYVGQANWWTVVTNPALTLDVFTSTGIYEGAGAVTKQGTTITSLATVYTVTEDPSNITIFTGKAFVDASYEADIVRAGNVTYTYGREARDTYNESLAGVLAPSSFTQFQKPVNPYWANGSLIFGVDAGPLPPVGSADTRVMPYSYRLCVTNDKSNQVPWPAPEGYNADDFEIVRRYATALGSPSIGDLVSELNYNGYPATDGRSMRYDLCESGGSAVSTDEPTAIYDDYIVGNRSVRAGEEPAGLRAAGRRAWKLEAAAPAPAHQRAAASAGCSTGTAPLIASTSPSPSPPLLSSPPCRRRGAREVLGGGHDVHAGQ